MSGLFSVWNLPQKQKKIIVLVTLLLAAAAIAIILRPVVVESLLVEAGDPTPQVAEFIISSKRSGRYLSGMPQNTSVPGVYDIIIGIGNKQYASTFIVRDTVAPSALAAEAAVWAEARVEPADFAREVYDATAVTLSFAAQPDTLAVGAQPVTVLLTDAGGNTTSLLSELRVYDTVAKLEVGPDTDKNALSALDFVENVADKDKERFALVTDISSIDFDSPGRRDIVVTLDNERRQSVLDVLDITAPQATAQQVRGFVSDILNPVEFVTDIIDQTPVTVDFVFEPDNMLEGDQIVTVLLTDAYGNNTWIESALTLIPDTDPPLIAGDLNKTIFVGDTIAYRADITVTDNRDAKVTLNIDSSAVEAKTAGKYPVIYSAEDLCGNTTVVQGSVTVLDVSREQVDEMADKILAGILKEDMDLYNAVNAIYTWVKNNIGYVSASVKGDPLLAAYRGIKDKRGECYILACVSELLLTRAGIDNVLIQRIEGSRKPHFWNLVNVGEGWYHLDTTPHENGGTCFMLTESQLQALAARRGSRAYYAYDKSLYPEAVE